MKEVEFEIEHPVTKEKLGILIDRKRFDSMKEDAAVPVLVNGVRKQYVKKYLVQKA